MHEKAPAYNLKVVIKETGLTPATLRAWERRYGLLKPQRSAGGHRLYSEDEIHLLKWLVERQKEGLSISRAIELWRSQARQPAALSQALPAVPAEDMLGQFRQQWVSACLDFNESGAEQAVAQALAIAAPEVVCTRVLQKGLSELGSGWYTGTVSVQQEHFASALVARRLNALFAAAPPPSRPGRLLAACPPGEDHDLALLMLAFMLRWRGWEVIYLGADVPLEQLDATLQATAPGLVLSIAQTLPAAASLLDLASFLNSRSIPLAYGGGIFTQIESLAARIPAHFLGHSVDAAPQVVERLLSRPPSAPISAPLPPAYAAALAGFQDHEALLISRVRQLMQSSRVAPGHLEIANVNFSRALSAALALGEIHLLDFSVEWLLGLLENYAVPPVFAGQYFQAFHQAVQEQPSFPAGPLLEWLESFQSRPDPEGQDD